MTLGEQIRKGREAAKLSQEELAERIGVSRQAVSKWESDRSVPTGKNKRALCQLLPLELPDQQEDSNFSRIMCVAGWGLAAALLAALVLSLARLHQMSETATQELEPDLQCVQFYDENQEEIFPQALWYNTAEIESILIQWDGDPLETVKVFFTPAGSETIEQTQLLEIRAPEDGGEAMLLSADLLHRDDLMGDLYFELCFAGDAIVTSESYNIHYSPALE